MHKVHEHSSDMKVIDTIIQDDMDTVLEAYSYSGFIY